MSKLSGADKVFITEMLKPYLEKDDLESVIKELFSLSFVRAPSRGVSPGQVGSFLHEVGVPIKEATKEYLQNKIITMDRYYMYEGPPCLIEVTEECWFDNVDISGLSSKEMNQFLLCGFKSDDGYGLYLPPCEVYYVANKFIHLMRINGRDVPNVFFKILGEGGFEYMFEVTKADKHVYRDVYWEQALC